jgi:hypothetical protein
MFLTYIDFSAINTTPYNLDDDKVSKQMAIIIFCYFKKYIQYTFMHNTPLQFLWFP